MNAPAALRRNPDTMVKGIGVDIIEVARVKRLLSQNNRFIERVFAEREIKYCERMARKEQHFAARFAAKEALFKALGTGWRHGMGWHEIVVENDEMGKPAISLHGETKKTFESMKFRRILLTLTHTSNYAVALVVLE